MFIIQVIMEAGMSHLSRITRRMILLSLSLSLSLGSMITPQSD